MKVGLTWGCTVLDRENISGPSASSSTCRNCPPFSAGREALSPPFLSFLLPLPLPLALPRNGKWPPLPTAATTAICPGRQGVKATVLPGQISAPPFQRRKIVARPGAVELDVRSQRNPLSCLQRGFAPLLKKGNSIYPVEPFSDFL